MGKVAKIYKMEQIEKFRNILTTIIK